jgi:hypothetical protein
MASAIFPDACCLLLLSSCSRTQAADERQERAISKLKDGWAAELKRQKDGWAAAEKQRREAWMQSKAAEIKDVTVKGLEGEVRSPQGPYNGSGTRCFSILAGWAVRSHLSGAMADVRYLRACVAWPPGGLEPTGGQRANLRAVATSS